MMIPSIPLVLSAILSCVLVDGVGAFGVSVGLAPFSTGRICRVSVPLAAVQEDDEYDDFYADFNPAEFETQNVVQDESRRRDSDSVHDYTRDSDADTSSVDVDAVNQLISKRLTMRKTGRFEEADEIRNELLDKHGVLVRDKDKKWRSGCSRSGSGLKWLRGSSATKRSGGTAPDFGPNGHDYVMAIEAGEPQSELSVEEINGMLAERLARKFNRDFKGADKIQEELLKAGVFVNDKNREWRADGKSFSGFEPNRYTMSDLCETPDDSTLEEIESMIKFRALLKADRLFQRADSIRDDLLYRYKVYIDDKSLQWSVGNPFPSENKWGNKYRPFEMARSSTIPDNVDEIQELLEERDSARINRDFDKADGIREQLVSEFNIYVNDKKREWSFGRTDDRSERSERVESKGFTQRGGGKLPASELAKVNDLLLERKSLKRERRYDEADAIRNQLMEDYGISIDDRNSEWRIRDAAYTMSQDSKAIDEEAHQKIQDMVENRVRAREARDFETADEIRDDLERNFSVSIDDRLREWYIE